MSSKVVTHTESLELTEHELHTVIVCLSSEVQNQDNYSGDYYPTLNRVLRKLHATIEAAGEKARP